MKTGVVKSFDGEYAFLSNFFMADFEWRNEIYPSGEHAFQAAKAYCMTDATLPMMVKHVRDVRACAKPGEAKGLGRNVKINIKEWNNFKVQWMREIIHAKFKDNLSDFDMVGSLINTGAMLLVEGNTWGDKFWGRCEGKGFNTLGAILMEERGYWLKGSPA